MKNLLLSLISCFFFYISSFACLPNGIIFNTQQEIDNFPINYPNCTFIEGSVNIEGSGITNLNGLSNVQEIQSQLVISACNDLVDLNGLNNLTFVNSLLISNSGIQSLSGLNSLQHIAYYFFIADNDSLQSLNGLESLLSIGNIFSVQNCNRLKNFVGVDSLSSVYNLQVSGNDSLINFVGLENVTQLNSLNVNNNPRFENFYGLENLVEIGSAVNPTLFMINSNEILEDFTGLSSLAYIYATMNFENLNTFQSFNGLNNLIHIHRILILSCPNINDLSALSPLVGLTSLEIMSCNALTDLDGLFNLNSIGNLLLTNNASLENIDALNNVHSLEEAYIGANESLTSLNLNALESVDFSLIISANQNLNNIEGLSNLQSVGGSCAINNNQNLTSLTGLESLLEVNSLSLSELPLIPDLLPLSNLNIIHNSLFLAFLDNIVSLEGLDNFNSEFMTYLNINNNQNLETCAIGPICQYFNINGLGNSFVENNASDCVSQNSIINECEILSVEDEFLNFSFSVFPNPTSEFIFIENDDLMQNRKVHIYDLNGKLLRTASLENTLTDISIGGLDAGIYLLKFYQDNVQLTTRKVVKK